VAFDICIRARWRKGGIKSTNALRTLHGAVSMTGHAFDGIAVVSDIVTSSDPRAVSSRLAEVVKTFKRMQILPVDSTPAGGYTKENILKNVGVLLDTVRKVNPLVHQVRDFVPGPYFM
jgi:thiamine-phosphate diphosphorylase / hydroxyethylthiazole kinase